MASIRAGLVDRIVRRLHLFGDDGADIATLRRRVARAPALVPPWADVRVAPVDAGGVPAEWVIPGGVDADRAVLYFHGGAWVMGSPRTHRGLVVDLARRAGVRALSLDYRLAPEHPYPAALDDGVTAYEWLLASGFQPGRIVLAGDSAGGNLVLALLLRLRDAGSPLPAGAVLLSPVTDLGCSGATWASRKAVDPFFARADLRPFIAAYAGTHDPLEPYLSPVVADLRGLPPLLVHVGDHEVLLDDAIRLGERASAAGVEARTVVWPGMMHVFHVYAPFLPEAGEANREISAFIRSRVGGPSVTPSTGGS
jgi:monoterpene epsilon-lactone hydrolase